MQVRFELPPKKNHRGVAGIHSKKRTVEDLQWMISEWPKSWLFAVWSVCRLRILDVLARYVGILMSHYKDPYGKPISIIWNNTRVLATSQSFLWANHPINTIAIPFEVENVIRPKGRSTEWQKVRRPPGESFIINVGERHGSKMVHLSPSHFHHFHGKTLFH